tara:strand:- start:507 stop:1691 length:1185 start_codon:yes stop_codon:yes gene_type:complete
MSKQQVASAFGAAMQAAGQGMLSVLEFKRLETLDEKTAAHRTALENLKSREIDLEKDRLAETKRANEASEKLTAAERAQRKWIAGKKYLQQKLTHSLDVQRSQAYTDHYVSATELNDPDLIAETRREKVLNEMRVTLHAHMLKLHALTQTAPAQMKAAVVGELSKVLSLGKTEDDIPRIMNALDEFLKGDSDASKYLNAAERLYETTLREGVPGGVGPVDIPSYGESRSVTGDGINAEIPGDDGIQTSPEMSEDRRTRMLQQSSAVDNKITEPASSFVKALQQIADDPVRVNEALRAKVAEDPTYSEAMAGRDIKLVLGPNAFFQSLTAEQIIAQGKGSTGPGSAVRAAQSTLKDAKGVAGNVASTARDAIGNVAGTARDAIIKSALRPRGGGP